jgi:hypothetical protein
MELTKQDYIIKGNKERLSLDIILPELFADYEYSKYYTDPESLDVYDCYLMTYDKITKSLKRRYIIEVKVREQNWNEWMLEKKKLTALNKKAGESGATILYINVTPSGSYVWNLSRIQKDIHWESKDCNISTVEMEKGKKTKQVTMLPTTLAKHFSLTDSQVDLTYLRDEKLKLLLNQVVEDKRSFCLMTFLLQKEDLKSEF